MTKMHISVIGGGISGASIANALSKCPQLTFNVFEAGPAIREMGAAIGFGVNAQKALEMIDPALQKALFDSSGGEREGHMRHFVGQGPFAGQHIMDVGTEYPQPAHVPRALFLSKLWTTVPDGVLQVNKKLKGVEPGQERRYKIVFEDGTSKETDAIIGTDGIRSAVRRLVLEHHPEAIDPVWTGFWDAQKLLPIEKAWDALSTKESYQSPADVRTNCLAGDPGFILLSHIPFKQLAVCVACGRADPTGPLQGQSSVDLTREFLKPYLDEFGDLGKGMTRLLLEEENPKAWFEWESAEAPFYHRDGLCIIGDAAHASTPWLGSGAAMAIEDAMLIGKLLAKVETASEIPAVFAIYSQLRLERTQKVVRGSRQSGLLMCGGSGLDLDVLKRKDAAVGAMDWILDFDLEKHVGEGLDLLEKARA